MKPVKRPASRQKCPTCGTTLEHEPSIAMQQELDDAVERGSSTTTSARKDTVSFSSCQMGNSV